MYGTEHQNSVAMPICLCLSAVSHSRRVRDGRGKNNSINSPLSKSEYAAVLHILARSTWYIICSITCITITDAFTHHGQVRHTSTHGHNCKNHSKCMPKCAGTCCTGPACAGDRLGTHRRSTSPLLNRSELAWRRTGPMQLQVVVDRAGGALEGRLARS